MCRQWHLKCPTPDGVTILPSLVDTCNQLHVVLSPSQSPVLQGGVKPGVGVTRARHGRARAPGGVTLEPEPGADFMDLGECR